MKYILFLLVGWSGLASARLTLAPSRLTPTPATRWTLAQRGLVKRADQQTFDDTTGKCVQLQDEDTNAQSGLIKNVPAPGPGPNPVECKSITMAIMIYAQANDQHDISGDACLIASYASCEFALKANDDNTVTVRLSDMVYSGYSLQDRCFAHGVGATDGHPNLSAQVDSSNKKNEKATSTLYIFNADSTRRTKAMDDLCKGKNVRINFNPSPNAKDRATGAYPVPPLS